jgi:hypothetical protein
VQQDEQQVPHTCGSVGQTCASRNVAQSSIQRDNLQFETNSTSGNTTSGLYGLKQYGYSVAAYGADIDQR